MAKFNEKYFKTSDAPIPTEGNTIDDILTSNEAILWRAKPDKKAFIWSKIVSMLPIALIWLIFDIGMIVLIATFMSDLPPYLIPVLCVFFLVHLTPFWTWLSNVLTANRQLKNTEYALTDQRIIIRSGIIGIDLVNIYYADIESVNLKVGLTDKLFKVGDIYIRGSFKAQVLYDINTPYKVLSELQKIINDIKTDSLYPNALRPQENPGYNTQYNPDNR